MATPPSHRAPPEESKANVRAELTERTLELTISWVYALRAKIEALEAQVTGQSVGPLEARIARLESEVGFLRGYLKAAGIKAPDFPAEPAPAARAPLPTPGDVAVPVVARPPFAPPPPELLRHLQVVTRAQWGAAVAGASGAGRRLTAIVDGYAPGTPAVIRVFRRDLEMPLATLPVLVAGGTLEAVWEHGELESMVAPEEGELELYFEVEIEDRRTASPVTTRAALTGRAQ